jgi:hypothetical protein
VVHDIFKNHGAFIFSVTQPSILPGLPDPVDGDTASLLGLLDDEKEGTMNL